MTNLEQTLAGIVELIEKATISRDSLALRALLRRKDVICAALAAPEQSWNNPQAQASTDVRRQREGETILVPSFSG